MIEVEDLVSIMCKLERETRVLRDALLRAEARIKQLESERTEGPSG